MRGMKILWFAQNSVNWVRIKRGITNSTVFKDFFLVYDLFEKPRFPISSSTNHLSPPPKEVTDLPALSFVVHIKKMTVFMSQDSCDIQVR